MRKIPRVVFAFVTVLVLVIQMNAQQKTDPRSFDGMLKQRKFNIVWITKENTTGIDNRQGVHQTINYSGKSGSIRKK